MAQLIDWAKITGQSQFGEDGMIDLCLERLNIERGTCVEVGAQDGNHLSNTYALREKGWDRTLIECDPELLAKAEKHPNDRPVLANLQPTGPESLDSIVGTCNFLSLDIDGNDYGILWSMAMRPQLVVAEFHPAIPWHVDMHGVKLGSSLRALTRMMDNYKGYSYVGATHCNAFFVENEEAHLFSDLECNPAAALKEESFTYLISTLADGEGEDILVGPRLFQKVN